jgi:hypothetical protein
MAKKIIFVWIIIIVLMIVLLGQETNEAEKIIEKYRYASGASVLSRIKSEIRTGTMLRGAAGRVPLETFAQASGKWHYHQIFAWGDQVCYGFDGMTAWIQDTQGISRMSPRQRLELQVLLDFQVPLNIHKYFPKMETIGSERIGRRESTLIIATSQEGIQTALAFDDETGLLLRAGDMIFEDYRNVGGVQRPFKILFGNSERGTHLQMKMEFSEIRHDIEVDETMFHLPTSPLTYTEAPLYKPRKSVEVGIEGLEACVGKYRHQERPEVIFTVTRQQNHLMVQSLSWGGQKLEIIPESDKDYFIEFLNLEFHFIPDGSGKVTHLEIKGERTVKAEKIGQP